MKDLHGNKTLDWCEELKNKGGLNELALFAGAGGGVLGSHLLGWNTVCAVERDAYAAQVLEELGFIQSKRRKGYNTTIFYEPTGKAKELFKVAL